MSRKQPQSAPNEGPASSLPRPPQPGPEGLGARLATPADEDALVALLERLSDGEIPATDPDLVRWATQTLLRRPVHGFVAVAGDTSVSDLAGVAVVSVQLDPVRGWCGDLARFWFEPRGEAAPEIVRWFLEETLEMARYHGVNRVRLTQEAGQILAVSAAGIPSWLTVAGEWAILRPHFEEDAGRTEPAEEAAPSGPDSP